MAEYHVLHKDNIDFLMDFTGKSEKELREMYEKSVLFDKAEVFWRIGNRVYNMQVAGQYVHYGMLDTIAKEAMECSIKEMANGRFPFG